MSPLDKRTCSTETYCSVFASFVLYWILQQIKKCNGILNKYLPDSFNLNIFEKKKKKKLVPLMRCQYNMAILAIAFMISTA